MIVADVMIMQLAIQCVLSRLNVFKLVYSGGSIFSSKIILTERLEIM